jgi:hypothetical protein
MPHGQNAGHPDSGNKEKDGWVEMGTLGDLRGRLNETPLWRELGEVPTRLDALKGQNAAHGRAAED